MTIKSLPNLNLSIDDDKEMEREWTSLCLEKQTVPETKTCFLSLSLLFLGLEFSVSFSLLYFPDFTKRYFRKQLETSTCAPLFGPPPSLGSHAAPKQAQQDSDRNKQATQEAMEAESGCALKKHKEEEGFYQTWCDRFLRTLRSLAFILAVACLPRPQV